MRSIGINETYLTILEDTNTGAAARTHIDIKPQRKYQYYEAWGRETQFSQNYSQQQFRRCLENAQLEEKGINIDGEKLSSLRFADDVALTTEDVKDMELQLNTVNEESLKIGLKIHKVKTKFMTNIDTTDNIQINGTGVEKVTNYKYLGQKNSNGKQNKTRSFNQNKSRMGCFWKVQRNHPGQVPSHESKKKGL